MKADDLTIEVRDITLERKGILLPEDISLKSVIRHCGVGEWTLELPAEHDMVPYLRQPGSGIIIHTRDRTFLSGPMTKPKMTASPEDPTGTLTFTGVDDNILVADAQAWPLPSQPDVGLQLVSNDVRTGPAETLMKAYVSANIGPTAPLDRRGKLAQLLTIQTDLGRGPIMTKSPRFTGLGDLLTEIATYAGFGWQIVQVGNVLEFQIYEIADRTAFIRFDIENGSLEEEEIEVSPPTVTRPIVAGQDQGEERTLLQRTNAISLQAELDWGRKIESFIDQRQTDDPLELQQAGDTALLDGGFTAIAVKAVPTDDDTREYGVDWIQGDKVCVVVFGQETPNTVTEVSLVANKSGVGIGAALGDVTGFQLASSLGGRVDDTSRRVESLEKNLETSTTRVFSLGANLNTYTTDGSWMVDDTAIANGLLNSPVPPLPAVAPNLCINPRSQASGFPCSVTSSVTWWTVTRGVAGPGASPYGTTTWDQVQPIGSPAGQGNLIASVSNVDGLGTHPYARTLSTHVNVNVAAEYRTQQGQAGATGIWTAIPTGTTRISWSARANTLTVLEVRRASAAAPVSTDRAWITDTKSDPGAGIIRSTPSGTFEVRATAQRVIQIYTALFSLDGFAQPRVYRRVRSADGVTWGPWAMDEPPQPVFSVATWGLTGLSFGATKDCIVEIRHMFQINPSTYWTSDGHTWQSNITSYPIDSPSWFTPTLQGAWVDYGGGFTPRGVMRTTQGLVILRGLVKSGANGSAVLILPVGYRPAYKLMILAAGSPNPGGNEACRVDIYPTGEVLAFSSVNLPLAWLSLDGIIFPCAEVAPQEAWQPVTLQNSWANLDAGQWGPARYWVDHIGRYHHQGVVTRASAPASGSAICTVPGLSMDASCHVPGVSDTGIYSSQRVENSQISWLAGGVAYVSLHTSPVIPSAVMPNSSFASLTLTAPWVNFGGTWPVASVWRAPDGLIHYRGLIGGGTTGQIHGAHGQGYRPSANAGTHIHPHSAANTFNRVDTTIDGTLQMPTTSASWVSLDGWFYLKEG